MNKSQQIIIRNGDKILLKFDSKRDFLDYLLTFKLQDDSPKELKKQRKLLGMPEPKNQNQHIRYQKGQITRWLKKMLGDLGFDVWDKKKVSKKWRAKQGTRFTYINYANDQYENRAGRRGVKLLDEISGSTQIFNKKEGKMEETVKKEKDSEEGGGEGLKDLDELSDVEEGKTEELSEIESETDGENGDKEETVEENDGGREIEKSLETVRHQAPHVRIKLGSSYKSGPMIPVSSFTRKLPPTIKRLDVPKDGFITKERMPIGETWRYRKAAFPGGIVPITNYHTDYVNPKNPIWEYQKQKYPQMHSSLVPENSFSTHQSYTVYKPLNPNKGLRTPTYPLPMLNGKEQEAYVKKQMFDQATATQRTGSGQLPPFPKSYTINEYK